MSFTFLMKTTHGLQHPSTYLKVSSDQVFYCMKQIHCPGAVAFTALQIFSDLEPIRGEERLMFDMLSKCLFEKGHCFIKGSSNA